MTEIKLIDIKKDILGGNRTEAEEIRDNLRENDFVMVNIMSSPGSGKTSLILKTIEGLRGDFRIGVIEGDIESMVDSEKIGRTGTPVVQLRTGGVCHLDATMIATALARLDPAHLDLVIIENLGNLVCPAEFDTGSDLNVVILSIPEGDDKPLKYPLIFSICHLVVINKTDYLKDSDFDIVSLKKRLSRLNPRASVVEVSCKTGIGIDSWLTLLKDRINKVRRSRKKRQKP